MRSLSQDTLDVLRSLHSQANGTWVRPLDIGGSNNSHHSCSLRTLERKKLVQSKQRSAWMSRGSKLYAITQAGREFVSKLPTD